MSDPLPSYQCGRIYGHPMFRGGCGKPVSFEESYRCCDCTASFHRECLRRHFTENEAATDDEIIAREWWICVHADDSANSSRGESLVTHYQKKTGPDAERYSVLVREVMPAPEVPK